MQSNLPNNPQTADGQYERATVAAIFVRFVSGIIAAMLLGAFPGLAIGFVASNFGDPWTTEPEVFWTVGVALSAGFGARLAWLGTPRSFVAKFALWAVSSFIAVFASTPATYFYFYADNPRPVIWVLLSLGIATSLANAVIWIQQRGVRFSTRADSGSR